MKKTTILTAVLAGTFALGSFAQTQKIKKHVAEAELPAHRTCGTLDHHEYLKQTRPNYEKELTDYNKMLDQWIENNKTNPVNNVQTTITIPVVIHVVYKTTAQNISDAQAISQFQVLNDDFQRHNSDTAIGSSFYNVAGGVPFQFCLATRDPNGNPTTGIVHVATTQTSFTTDDKVKFTAQGGDDAWDVSKYMNIWVCNLGGGLLGYGEFPTGSLSNTYGLVLGYFCTGTMGAAAAPYDGGRTGTHEFGHCFNLLHIWGDDGGACTGSDQCSDTPNQAGENYGCPTLPLTDACTTTAPGVMCMNYMDYVDDACMVMFTQQQCTRMLAVVSNAPYNILQSSDGCLPTTLNNDDASCTAVTSPTGSSCSASITPVITLKNMGQNNLTSCTITYNVDGGTSVPYSWTGNLASLASTNVTLPSSTTTAGSHTVNVTITNPNGNTDADPSNNTGNTSFSVIAGSGAALPFSEGFEGTTFVPTGWLLNNPNNDDTWVRNTGAAKTGVASASIDNYTNDFTGNIDEMVTPGLDLTSQSNPKLTFEVAYKLYSNPATSPNYSDTLEVLISTDCGATYQSIYKKFGTALTTTTPTYAASAFTPTASQWRLDSVPLAAYASANLAYIKFRNISQYENFLYIDDINIAGTVGIKENVASNLAVSVYPNPNNGNFYVNVVNGNMENVSEINIYNVLGAKVMGPILVKGPNVTQPIDVTNLSNGVYQIETKTNGWSTFNKVVVGK